MIRLSTVGLFTLFLLVRRITFSGDTAQLPEGKSDRNMWREFLHKLCLALQSKGEIRASSRISRFGKGD